MAKVPDRDYTPGIYPLERPGVTAGDGGVTASMSREHLSGVGGPDINVAILRIVMVMPNGQEIIRSAEVPGGVALLKDGTPAAFSFVSADWPGELQDGQRKPIRPDSLRLDFVVLQPLRCAIEIDAVKLASVEPQGGLVHN